MQKSADTPGVEPLLFRWDKNLETGIAIIDEQHHHLVDLVNQLAQSIVQQHSTQNLSIYEDLKNYAAYHFETERQIWYEALGTDDPWCEEHDHAHAQFLPAIENIFDENETDSRDDFVEKIFRYLVRWLLFHILEEDKKLAYVVLAVKQGIDKKNAKALANSRASTSFNVFIDTLLSMHDQLAIRTFSLIREQQKRERVQIELEESNAQLANLSITDQLTGLHNRRYFDATLDEELRRSKRNNTPLALIYADIDDFKRLNDHYGHIAGDHALQQIAGIFKNACQRSADYAFRIGGEEFAILLADTDIAKATAFAETLRVRTETLAIPNCRSRVCEHVTLSLGAFAKIPEPHDTPDYFLQQADLLLYRAKSTGRNCVASPSN
ncbi:hemerythrin [Alteromonadaceae bacterium 2753L.S.0a.02]|nr:hemerythrin [Alteromonadaceae bacterium 2753L.S.0a.02]